ncbi:hypothetical protein [Streptomyces sp. NPDC002187]|uniref:hypothetical protein n=1 Tax=Streptomyces sp. NPDC002187 TaxID=3364637 RepID=UPI0036A0B564
MRWTFVQVVQYMHGHWLRLDAQEGRIEFHPLGGAGELHLPQDHGTRAVQAAPSGPPSNE